MIHVVPAFVQAGIRFYDSALRLKWSPLAQQFVLQRKIQNAPPGSYDALMATLQKRVDRLRTHEQRLAVALVQGSETQIEETIVSDTLRRVVWGRTDAGVRLEALRDGYLFVYWVPPPTAQQPWPYRLRCILYTLRQNDIWVTGGADRCHAELVDADLADEQRADKRQQGLFRDGAGEVFDDMQRKAGERILLGTNLKPQEPLILTGA